MQVFNSFQEMQAGATVGGQSTMSVFNAGRSRKPVAAPTDAMGLSEEQRQEMAKKLNAAAGAVFGAKVLFAYNPKTSDIAQELYGMEQRLDGIRKEVTGVS